MIEWKLQPDWEEYFPMTEGYLRLLPWTEPISNQFHHVRC